MIIQPYSNIEILYETTDAERLSKLTEAILFLKSKRCIIKNFIAIIRQDVLLLVELKVKIMV